MNRFKLVWILTSILILIPGMMNPHYLINNEEYLLLCLVSLITGVLIICRETIEDVIIDEEDE